jgi:hypothetical protein
MPQWAPPTPRSAPPDLVPPCLHPTRSGCPHTNVVFFLSGGARARRHGRESGPRHAVHALCDSRVFAFPYFLGVEDMIYLFSKYYREKVRLLIHFDSMSQVYSVLSNVSGGPLAFKCRQDVKFCIFRAFAMQKLSIVSVTEPTNYTKLNKKITRRRLGADNLANLSSYNSVVREITTNFKPTNISTKIVQV